MTTNVLNSMGAGLDSSESTPKTADDPFEKLATYGMPYQSMNIANLYASNGRVPPNNMGLMSGMANSMSQWPSMYGQSLAGGQFGSQGMQTQSLYPESNGLDSFKRTGLNQMTNLMALSGQMAGYSPMSGQMPGFSPMFPFNQQFPQLGYGNSRAMMGMGMGMNMMNPGFSRSLPARRSGRRYRRYRSSHGKRQRRRPIDVDEEDYPYYKTSYRSSASEDRYRLHAPEADSSNAVESAAHYPDHSPSSSENIYKVATGLTSGGNKEFLKIGGIGGLLNGKADQKASEKISPAQNSSKEVSSDNPFIQFGSTKISLKRNVKGGITVTVGKLDN